VLEARRLGSAQVLGDTPVPAAQEPRLHTGDMIRLATGHVLHFRDPPARSRIRHDRRLPMTSAHRSRGIIPQITATTRRRVTLV